MSITQNIQSFNNNYTSLQHIGNIAHHKGKSATSYGSVNSLTTHNNQYTLLYPDLVQELFNFSLHNSNSVKNNALFLRNGSFNNTKSSSLDSSLSPRDILFFLQIVSLYQLELSKGNTFITYPSLKLAKLLGVDASCDTTHLTANTHNSVNSLTDANMRATILKMTAKLESLEMLKVFRRKRSNGMDMANKLIPVLPDRLYARIKELPANLKVSDSSKLEHESNLEHILRTKLFVPIELEFMKSLFKNNLPSKYKLFFLNCIMSAYRNFRHNSRGSNILSFSATSSELIQKNNISRSTLDRIFRYVKQQGDSFFLQVEHKYTKSNDIDCNRYDKSIFVISINPVVFPISKKIHSQEAEITEFDYDIFQCSNPCIFPDTYRGFKTVWSKKQPSIIKKTALNNKDIIIKENNKNIDANINKNLDEKNEVLDKLSKNNQIKPQTFLQTSHSDHLESEQSSLSSKSLKNIFKDFMDALPFQFQDISDRKNKLNIPNNCNTIIPKQTASYSTNIGIHKKTAPKTKASNDRKHKDFRHFYPISEKDAKTLNFKANREFGTNFTNQLLLKLYIKYPEKRFKNRFTFLSYMVKALKEENHQAMLVNNPSFRFSCNIDEQEKRVLECEQYLIKVESSSGTCKISQVKKKIAGRFSSEISYSILTKARFIESSSKELLTILLPENLALSDMQREILTSEVCSVYGNNKCYLDRVKTGLKISAAVAKEEGNIEEAQSESTSDLSCSKPRSTPLSTLPEDSVWRQVRQALVLQYGNGIDTAWFSKAVASECKETSLLLLTMPTRFMADWVRNYYSHVIRRLAGSCGIKSVEYAYE
ncbi:DnaA N-terminal domain-containing protein [Rickettsia asembonensis]|uniref:DnaA N-terminal domain-containing protein n=1 Tax=Rickettsia asembonensis TaxID=1068590 RepID=A0A0C2R9B0_9RICK|nr:DnaA N-terminal domain-containing protein [Rickettsia asembonensis]KIJ88778.1 hypothetical protein SB78_03630 [Rickettsia asembonensis]